MRAIAYHEYGPAEVLHIEEMPRPELKPQEYLVRVYATSVNPIDWKVRRGDFKFMTGRKFPKIPGSDFSGVVLAAGAQANKFAPGDRVFGLLDTMRGGACAEEIAVEEQFLAAMPAKLDFEQAASLPLVATTTLQAYLKEAPFSPGQRVLVNGCSGGVGTAALQIARALSAKHVAGVCSTKNVEMSRDLGADMVFDYTDRSQTSVWDSGERYDVVFDTVGTMPYRQGKKLLAAKGTLVSTAFSPDGFFYRMQTSLLPGRKMRQVVVKPSGADLEQTRVLVEAGRLRPVIDRVYGMEDARQAHEHSEGMHARGKIIISFNPHS